jgi:hypothetical protein
MESERREEQEAYFQAHVRLPPKQVHQSWSKGSSYEAVEILNEARMPRVTEANETEAKRTGNAEGGYDLMIAQPLHFAHPLGHPGASSSQCFPATQMQWCPPLWVNYTLMMPMTPWCLGHLANQFLKVWSSQQTTELIHPSQQ